MRQGRKAAAQAKRKKGIRGKKVKIEIDGEVTRKKSERKRKNACKHEDPATVDEAQG